MKCIYCGAEMPDGSVFCAKCGREVQMVQNMEALEDEYLTGILEQGQQKKTGASPADIKRKKQEAMRKEQERRKKKKRLTIFYSVIAVVILCGVGTGFYIKHTIDVEHANSADYQIMKAQEAYASGDYKTAIAYYENALNLDDTNLDVKLTLAGIYYDRKDYDSALILYLEVLEADPQNEKCYRNLISIYEHKNKTDEIIALSKNVTDPDILALFSDYIVNAPTFSTEGGKYNKYLEIALASDSGNQIYYTMDGSDPSVYGRVYREPLSLDKEGEYSIRAVCVNAKKLYSDIVVEDYVIDILAPSMPVVTPNGGTFDEETLVSITVPQNCTAYYTWDGTIPSVLSDKYIAEMPVPDGNNILSVMIVDEKTGKWSEIYRGRFVYYPVTEADVPAEGEAPADGTIVPVDGSTDATAESQTDAGAAADGAQ